MRAGGFARSVLRANGTLYNHTLLGMLSSRLSRRGYCHNRTLLTIEGGFAARRYPVPAQGLSQIVDTNLKETELCQDSGYRAA